MVNLRNLIVFFYWIKKSSHYLLHITLRYAPWYLSDFNFFQCNSERAETGLCAHTIYNCKCGLCSSWNLLSCGFHVWTLAQVGITRPTVHHPNTYVCAKDWPGQDWTNKLKHNTQLKQYFQKASPASEKAALLLWHFYLLLSRFSEKGHQSWELQPASFRATETLICLFTLLMQQCREVSSRKPSLWSVRAAQMFL